MVNEFDHEHSLNFIQKLCELYRSGNKHEHHVFLQNIEVKPLTSSYMKKIRRKIMGTSSTEVLVQSKLRSNSFLELFPMAFLQFLVNVLQIIMIRKKHLIDEMILMTLSITSIGKLNRTIKGHQNPDTQQVKTGKVYIHIVVNK